MVENEPNRQTYRLRRQCGAASEGADELIGTGGDAARENVGGHRSKNRIVPERTETWPIPHTER
jgi:hypothetical protein